MNKLITILSKRKIITLVLLLGYSFFLLFFHEKAGYLFQNLTASFDRTESNKILFLIFFLFFLVYLIVSLKYFVYGYRQIFYLLFTTLISVFSIKFLLVNNIELIHFFQYFFLCILIFSLYKRVGGAIFLTGVFGILDESYQYYNTYNELRPTLGYFDFNDVLLNILGAGFGGIILFSQKSEKLNFKNWILSRDFLLLIIITVIFFILVMSNILAFFTNDQTIIILNQQLLENSPFWTTVPPEVIYHIIKPLEGTILTITLFVFYLSIDLKPNFALYERK